jgi:hypothetical protein
VTIKEEGEKEEKYKGKKSLGDYETVPGQYLKVSQYNLDISPYTRKGKKTGYMTATD